eukprot:TRINITY_DN110_c0_g1_i7.p2 TRINITY_DN110_c0_g1~~TRINITY_DN110_c0_g1_i7.p2  ORF type:complete len:151 (+),score=50.88 TRINITY_DN110_c0_g1_i7:128-580(+)
MVKTNLLKILEIQKLKRPSSRWSRKPRQHNNKRYLIYLLANRAAVSVLKGEKAQLEKNLAAQVEAAEGFKKDIEKMVKEAKRAEEAEAQRIKKETAKEEAKAKRAKEKAEAKRVKEAAEAKRAKVEAAKEEGLCAEGGESTTGKEPSSTS